MVTNNYIQIIRQPAGLKLTPRDPRWIGAWWPGFLIFGSAILLWALIILGFPREMPGAKDLRAKHISQGHLKRANGVEIPRFKDILPELKHLLTNWTFLFNTLALSILMLFASPIATFFAKILRLKFGLDPMTTGYVLALISILSIARTFVYKMLFSKSCRGHQPFRAWFFILSFFVLFRFLLGPFINSIVTCNLLLYDDRMHGRFKFYSVLIKPRPNECNIVQHCWTQLCWMVLDCLAKQMQHVVRCRLELWWLDIWDE